MNKLDIESLNDGLDEMNDEWMNYMISQSYISQQRTAKTRLSRNKMITVAIPYFEKEHGINGYIVH